MSSTVFKARHHCTAAIIFVSFVLFATALASVEQGARYDIATSERGWWYSRSANCATHNIDGWNCGEVCLLNPNFQTRAVHINDDLDTLAYTGVDTLTKEIVVVFRSTSTIQNWIQDLKFFFTPYLPDHGNNISTRSWEVHRGFQQSYLSVRERVLADVAALTAQFPDYTLFVTGHSLGGAMATLCAVDLSIVDWPIDEEHVHNDTLAQMQATLIGGNATPEDVMSTMSRTTTVESGSWQSFAAAMNTRAADEGSEDGSAVSTRPKLTTYTYGSPRVGNSAFAAAATELLWNDANTFFRITHAHDPVPHLPPQIVHFHHVATEIFYEESDLVGRDRYRICDDTGVAEDMNCILGFLGLNVSDHLSYMGTCAECSCTPSRMVSEEKPFELSSAHKAYITEEHTNHRRT